MLCNFCQNGIHIANSNSYSIENLYCNRSR